MPLNDFAGTWQVADDPCNENQAGTLVISAVGANNAFFYEFPDVFRRQRVGFGTFTGAADNPTADAIGGIWVFYETRQGDNAGGAFRISKGGNGAIWFRCFDWSGMNGRQNNCKMSTTGAQPFIPQAILHGPQQYRVVNVSPVADEYISVGDQLNCVAGNPGYRWVGNVNGEIARQILFTGAAFGSPEFTLPNSVAVGTFFDAVNQCGGQFQLSFTGPAQATAILSLSFQPQGFATDLTVIAVPQ